MFGILSATMVDLNSALLRYLLAMDFSSSGQAGFIIFYKFCIGFVVEIGRLEIGFKVLSRKQKTWMSAGVNPRILFTIRFNHIKLNVRTR